MDASFEHEYKVVRLKDRYHLVKTTVANASSNQQLVPDSEDELHSVQSSDSMTLGSADDAPSPHSPHIKHHRSQSSSSSRHPCPNQSVASESSQQEGNALGNYTGLQPQQQQDRSSGISGIAHCCACSALAGVSKFYGYSAAAGVGLIAAYTQYVQMQWQHDLAGPGTRPTVGKFARERGDQTLPVCKTEDMLVDSNSGCQAVNAPSANSDQVCS